MSNDWRNVNSASPCRWCGEADRCSWHTSGEVFVCRTKSANEGITPRIASDGSEYWVHTASDLFNPNIDKPPELTTELPSALDQPYLHQIYLSLLTHIQQNSTTIDILLKRYGYTQADGDIRRKELLELFNNQLLYRPIPRANKDELAGYIAGLHDPHQIAKVPGFYKKDGKWCLNLPNANGILIPVRNTAGEIDAIKIRLNDAKQNKYLSLSSSRFGGPKAKAVVHFPQGYNKHVAKKTIRIVEGEIKADIAMLFSDTLSISIPGVSSWAKSFEAIREVYRSNGYAPSEVRVAFDSDARVNPRVASSLECLCEEILNGADQYTLGIETWPDEFKGIDDALVARAPITTLYNDDAVNTLQQIIRKAGIDKDEEVFEELIYRMHNASVDSDYLHSDVVIHLVTKLTAAEQLRFYSAACKVPSFDNQRFKAAVKEVKEGQVKRREDKASIQAQALDRPAIETFDRPTDLISEDAVQSLYKINDPPRIFRFGAEVARTKYSGLELEILDEDMLSAELNRSALWVTTTGRNRTIVDCPNKISKYIIQSPEIWNGIPSVNSFIYWSCVTPHMKILKDAGYHKEVEAILKPRWSTDIPDIPASPSSQEIQNAKELFANLFYDFPFENEASKAIAYALVFTQVFSLVIKDKPFFVIEGSMPGSGKGKLVDCCTVPFNCERITRRPYAGQEEVRKTLYGILSALPSYVMFDNVTRCIDSSTLALVLTTNTYSDRELGKSHNPEFPVNCIWIATGNNISASEEISRRMVRCTLQPKTAKPYLRTGFRIENIDAHLREDGWKYQHAALILTQAWLNDGCKRIKITFGSYQEWAEIIGGILQFIGIEGFLSDIESIMDDMSDGDNFTPLFMEYVKKFWGFDKPFSPNDLYNMCSNDMNIAVSISGRDENQRRISFGQLIRNSKGRIHGDMQLLLHPTKTTPRQFVLRRIQEE
jgi:hypothetical protein